MSQLVLERFGYMPFGTYGKLKFPNGEEFYTVERPWLNNEPNISCIPEGIYELGLRYSPVVKRTTGGEFTEGWEVMDVPNRSYIMLHPANWPNDVQGCIGVGKDLIMLAETKDKWLPAVTRSRHVFHQIMSLLGKHSVWDLNITHLCIDGSDCG